jgi:hypothetical protein
MSTLDYMMDVVARLRMVLDAHDRHMRLFDLHAIQVEGWLKGELLHFFDAEKTNGKLHNYWSESPPEYQTGPSQKRIDYELELLDGTTMTKVWIELKHFQIGYQKEECWKATDYFVSKSYGIHGDVAKLREVVVGDKYILVLATKNPGRDDWLRGVNKFNEKFSPFHIQSHKDPSNFPATYFLGLLEVASP